MVAGGGSVELVSPGEEITVKVLRLDEDTQKIALGLKQLRTIRGPRSPRTRSDRCSPAVSLASPSSAHSSNSSRA